MEPKQKLLTDIKDGLNTGLISEEDIKTFIQARDKVGQIVNTRTLNKESATRLEKLSAVDIMFYIAGIVLYSAIVSIIVQSWGNSDSLVQVILSAGVGTGLWSLAYYLIRSPYQNEVRNGLINATLLTGSLLVVTGGYIVTNELIGGFESINFIPGAIMLAVLGIIHLGFDMLIKRDLILLVGVLLCVAFFPTLLFGFLQDAGAPMDLWSVIAIVSSAILTYAPRVVANINPDRKNVRSSFDSVAAFIALATMYTSSFGDYGVLWLSILIASIFGIFYISIVSQNKHLLGNASFFLVLVVITISIKYFSGYGVTTSLILAAVGLLSSAAVASSINKKYFRQSGNLLYKD